tara:strand:+ start:18358 stop:19332 length:975 start_codon:yes stop_codon:yes gene_type:complete
MYSAFEEEFSAGNSMLLWHGKESDLLLASRLIQLPQNILVLDIITMDTVLMRDFQTIKKIKNTLNQLNTSQNTKLCSSYASGIYFELIKSILSIENSNVIQFDDGLNELLEVNYYRVIKSLICMVHGIHFFPSKFKLFSDSRFKHIYTSINPGHVVRDTSKAVVDISERVSRTYSQISESNLNVMSTNAAVLMTTHSVESGRTSKNEFQALIGEVYNRLKSLGAQEIYLSKHPTEKCVNDEFYKSIGLNTSYQDFPSELLVANKNITFIGNPFNSTLIMCNHLKLLNHIKTVVSYWPINAPHKLQRTSMIESLMLKYDADHYII